MRSESSVQNLPNANTEEKTKDRERSEKPVSTPMISIRGGAQRSKQDQDTGRIEKRPFPRVMVTDPAEEQLAENGACKRNGRYVRPGRGVCVFGGIDGGEHGTHRADDPRVIILLSAHILSFFQSFLKSDKPVEVAIGEQSSAAGNGRPAALPTTLPDAL